MDDKQKKTLGLGLGALALVGLGIGLSKIKSGGGGDVGTIEFITFTDDGQIYTFYPVTEDSGLIEPISFQWSFGDGATSTAAPVEHTFPGDGSYTVSLTATDSTGKTASRSHTIPVGSGNGGDWLSKMPPVPAGDWLALALQDKDASGTFIVRDLGSGYQGPQVSDDPNNPPLQPIPTPDPETGEIPTYANDYWGYLYKTSLYLSQEDMSIGETVWKEIAGVVSVDESNTPFNDISQFSAYSYPTHWHLYGWIPKFASKYNGAGGSEYSWVPAVVPDFKGDQISVNGQPTVGFPYKTRYPYFMLHNGNTPGGPFNGGWAGLILASGSGYLKCYSGWTEDYWKPTSVGH